VTNTHWDVTKTNWLVGDAWRAGRHPDALTEAIKIGEQIIELMTQAIDLIERACAEVDSIVQNANLRCQVILDHLYGQINRLDPVLSRLRAASKAVTS
jgi:hypothetical protein